jgi:hypothetical protein
MGIGSTLFSLNSDVQGAFDGSSKGIALAQSPNAKPIGADAGFHLNRGFIELARHRDLDNLQSFTIEAAITPDSVGGERRNILEGQSPAVAFFIEANGKLVGSVNTANGWVGVDSGATLVKAGVESRVAFTRDDAGKMELRINGAVVGSKVVPGPIQNVGNLGFKIGAWVDGQRFPFVGKVADVQIRQGVANAQFFSRKIEAAKRIEQAFKVKTGLERVSVNLLPDFSASRLQPIKDIMNAAGVQKLSDLDTLRINVRTVMTPGKVLVAARKSPAVSVDWSKVAKEFVVAGAAGKRDVLARMMTNRNSAGTLNKFQVAAPLTPTPIGNNPPIFIGGRIAEAGDENNTGLRVPAEVLRDSPSLRLANQPVRIGDLFKQEGAVFKLRDPNVIGKLESPNPSLWAITSPPTHQLHSLKTIPVNSAVMIGHTIDLTETEDDQRWLHAFGPRSAIQRAARVDQLHH